MRTTTRTARPTEAETLDSEPAKAGATLPTHSEPDATPSTSASFAKHLLYLLLGLPLGTLYLTVVLTGASLGIGLMPLALLGIPTTIVLWYALRSLIRVERSLATTLLGAQIDPIPPVPRPSGGLWRHFKAVITDRYGWKTTIYLLARFPAGLLTFTIALSLAATSLALTLAPTYMWTSSNRSWLGQWFDSYLWSFALVPIGLLLSLATVYAINAMAHACRRWTTDALTSRPRLGLSRDEQQTNEEIR